VNELVNCSLVQEQYDEQRCVDNYSLHRVMVEFVQSEYAVELPELIKSVYSFYRSGTELDHPKTLKDLRPALEAQHFAFQLRNYSEAKDLLYKLEKYLEPWGYWTLHKQLCKQIVDRIDENSQPYILARLGSRERDWGNWDSAERFYKAGLTAMKMSLTPRFCSSVKTESQNLEDSFWVIHNPNSSFCPARLTPKAM
jgi:hypothetical protein